jgi:hypothetical protein
MDMQAVASRNIAYVGYDQEKLLLLVQFRNGRTYEYYNVPEEVYAHLMGSQSLGKYFENFIRRRYEYKETSIS